MGFRTHPSLGGDWKSRHAREKRYAGVAETLASTDTITLVTYDDDVNLTDSRLVEHVGKVFCRFPPDLPAGASSPPQRDIYIFRDTEKNIGILDMNSVWWFEGVYEVVDAIKLYEAEIRSWGDT